MIKEILKLSLSVAIAMIIINKVKSASPKAAQFLG